ncbi:MAG: prolyl oligopeptidase family serine peptidase [Myxococcales bacterium]|nr:prolyl oligopeptidase family serine peptidase [Myxococcales bacterium]
MIRSAPLTVAVTLVGGAAHAEITLAPGADGSLGAWLLAGPVSSAAADKQPLGQLSPRAGQSALGARWRLLAEAPGALDLGKQLGLGRTGGGVAFLGAKLSAERPFDGWLLLSADGAVRVSVAGKQVFARDEPHLRHYSWDAIRVSVPKGDSDVVIRLTHPGQWFAVEARLLGARDLAPPRDVRVSLPGTDADDESRAWQKLVSLDVTSGLDRDGYAPVVSVKAPRGVPRRADTKIKAEVSVDGGKPLYEVALGSLPLNAAGVYPLSARLPEVAEKELGRSLTVRVTVGGEALTRTLSTSKDAVALVRRAEKLSPQDATVKATLEWELAELGRTTTERHLSALLDALERNEDPLSTPGVRRLARRSKIDGAPDPMLVHVPARLDAKKRYPLVVALHGLNGTPDGIMEAFLDSQSHAPQVDGFVLAPYAHGNAFYRGPGEQEVLDAIDWALATYPIDPDRVSITGVSMGGTGTAQVAFHHADRFSAAAPLCGYHSYWVRRDTSKRPLRPWERARMDHWSTTRFADNARHVPLWVAQGTKDFPLANSRVLVDRVKQLGYAITDEWPDTGHAVWKKTYAQKRLYPWLTRAKRPRAPSHVTLVTDSYAEGKSYWVRITQRKAGIARVDAEAKNPTRLEVTTENVDGLLIDRDALSKDQPVDVVIDGATLRFDAAIELARKDGKWQAGHAAPGKGDKRPGVEGPIRSVYDGPLAFVYGSGSPATRRANREVAEYFAHVVPGPDVDYPVLADYEVTGDEDRSLVLVGTPSDHRLLAGTQLPIRVHGGKLAIGAETFAKAGTGAIFVVPSPRREGRQWVVVTGVDAAGIWRALSLPALLPDFLVYDEGLALAAGEQVLGQAHVLAGGMFDEHWALPGKLGDAPGEARD